MSIRRILLPGLAAAVSCHIACANPEKPANHAEADMENPEADMENPEKFYPRYLEKLTALPADKQFAYAASLPIRNNPALVHRITRRHLTRKLQAAQASGLGHRHPDITALRQSLATHRESAGTALRMTIEILEGKREPGLADQEIRFLHDRLRQKTASGLGHRHPSVILLKKRIRQLEKEAKHAR